MGNDSDIEYGMVWYVAPLARISIVHRASYYLLYSLRTANEDHGRRARIVADEVEGPRQQCKQEKAKKSESRVQAAGTGPVQQSVKSKRKCQT
eukprot:6194040-Pleurochrysis_carterae.AAC.2